MAHGLLLLTTLFSPPALIGEDKRLPAPELVWVNSGVWSNDGQTLYLADIRARRIVSIVAETGGTAPTPKPWPTTRASFSYLQSLLHSAGPYIIESDGKLFFLREDFADSAEVPVRLYEIEAAKRRDFGGLGQIASAVSWAVAGRHLYAFGDVQRDGQRHCPEWASGFLRIPLAQPKKWDYVLDMRLSKGDTMKVFYRLGLHMFAADGETAFALVMDTNPYLLRMTPENASVLELSEKSCGYSRPSVPIDPKGRSGAVEVYRTLEQSEGPIGVYVDRGSIYILCREETGDGLRFFLSEIDGSSGVEVQRFRIATAAANVTVIPGARYWAVLEKGPVQAGPDQDAYMPIESILFMDPPAQRVGKRDVRADERPSEDGHPASIRKIVWGGISFLFSGIGIAIFGWLWRRRRARREQ